MINNYADPTAKYVGTKEKVAFYISAMFRDMSYALMAYLSYFYIDVLGLAGAALGVILVLMRVWDGINDPIMGAIFDKSSGKKGKARPFFLTTGIPAGILIIIMFSSPTFSGDPKINTIYRLCFVFATYIVFEGFHTLNGTSFMSLYNSISPNPEERAKIISVSRLFSALGSGALGIIPILLGFFDNTDVQAKANIYFFTAMVVGLAFIIYNVIMHKYVKERHFIVQKTAQPISKMLRVFLKNKLLLLMMLSNTIIGILTAGNVSLWFYTYNMGNPALLSIVGICMLPTLLLGTYLTPYLIKKFEKRDIVIGSGVFQVLINLLFLIVGYDSLVFVMVISLLNGLPMTVKNIIYWSMVSDSVDYLEWKTEKRNDGMIYSIEGFLGKCLGSIGALSTIIIIAVIDFVPNAESQSEYTLKGLFYLPLLLTIAGTIFGTIPYFFYRFSKAEHLRVLGILKERKELKEEF